MANRGGKDAPCSAYQDDDYIAQLLAKDARDCSIRYSSLGMYGSAPPRPAGRVPKPNTRFLKNILRDTDTHNANLKRKEEEDARERMRRLRQGSARDTNADSVGEDASERSSKRRRVESPRNPDCVRERTGSRRSKHGDDREGNSEEPRRRQPKSRRHERTQHEPDTASELNDKPFSQTTRDREAGRREGARHRQDGRHHHRRDDSKGRPGDGEPTSDREKRHSSRSRRRSRIRSPRRKQSHSRDRRHRRGASRRSHDSRTPSNRNTPTADTNGNHYTQQLSETSKGTRQTVTDGTHDVDSEDDPLSNLIGPLPPSTSSHPPIHCRGRGAYKANGSNIDTHFAAGYDPSLDVHINNDGDEEEDETSVGSNAKPGSRRPVPGLTTESDDIDNDWNMALEALRDRAVWRRKGAERLRQAGFEENVVERWANSDKFLGLRDDGGGAHGRSNSDMQGVADVRWAKKGEGREWDRGKVVNDEGHIDVKAPW